MAQPNFVLVKQARMQAYSDYLQSLRDAGEPPQVIAKLQRYRGALASAQKWGDDLPELMEWHEK